jgi:hemolysin activation/secretion protein
LSLWPSEAVVQCWDFHFFSLFEAVSMPVKAPVIKRTKKQRTESVKNGALFSALVTCAVTAAAAPDAGSLLNELQRQQTPAPQKVIPQELKSLLRTVQQASGPKVSIRSVRFSGTENLATPAELQALVASATGKMLDFNEMEKLAGLVTGLLRQKGFFLARAYLPKQDITLGVLEIALLGGRLQGQGGQGKPYVVVPDTVQPPRIALARIGAIADQYLRPGALARLSDLERAVLLINDLPGVSAQARIEPGGEPGTTRVVIGLQEGPLLASNASLSNSGNGDTGVTQLNLGATLSDPFKIGDQFSLIAVHAQGVNLVNLRYSLPVGHSGGRFEVARTDMRYRIIRGTGLSAGLAGESASSSASFTYPLARSRSQSVLAGVTYGRKAFANEASLGVLSDKRIDSWAVTLSGQIQDLWVQGGAAAWGLGLTSGQLDLAASAANAAADAAGYNTQGHFQKVNYNAAHLTRLAGDLAVYASLSGQFASKNLDSSEQFLLGGASGVRAYPSGEGAGDEGWLAKLEMRYELPGLTFLGPMQLVGFYDLGGVRLHRSSQGIPIPTATGKNRYQLSGWGVGLTLNLSPKTNVNLAWARALGDNPGRSAAGRNVDNRADRSRFWLQANISF